MENPKKVIFDNITHTIFWLFTLHHNKTNCNQLAHRTREAENVTTLLVKCKTFASGWRFYCSSINIYIWMRKRLSVWLTDPPSFHVVGAVSHVAVRYMLQLVDVEIIGCIRPSFTVLDFNGARPLTTTVVVAVVIRHTHSPRDRSWVLSCNIHRIAQSSAGLNWDWYWFSYSLR